MKQAQQMQKKVADMEANLINYSVEGVSGSGLVTLTVNGKFMLTNIKISPSLMNKDENDVLEDLIIAAYNDAKTKVEQYVSVEMNKVTGGMNLPGGMKLPF